jgi:hypothetical protein
MSKLCYDRRSVSQSVLVSSTHLGHKTRFLLLCSVGSRYIASGWAAQETQFPKLLLLLPLCFLPNNGLLVWWHKGVFTVPLLIIGWRLLLSYSVMSHYWPRGKYFWRLCGGYYVKWIKCLSFIIIFRSYVYLGQRWWYAVAKDGYMSEYFQTVVIQCDHVRHFRKSSRRKDGRDPRDSMTCSNLSDNHSAHIATVFCFEQVYLA